MFVVFEGIDGSGKTTVSNMVAEALRERGIKIDHIREGGEFASPLVSRMREFGKDTRNVALRPLAEFLMYVARDAQLLDECVNPTLAKGGLVFADRYLYSYEVLGHYGRGLELEQVRPIIDSVAGGVWPELVILMDVDPQLARARRRVSKIQKKGKVKASASAGSKGGSRKGLGGVGMMHRLRNGYLQLAQREPNRWLVIDNGNTDLQVVVDRVTEAIVKLYEGAPAAKVVASTSVKTRANTSAEAPTLDAAQDAFYEMIRIRSEKEPAVAAYFLSGLVDPAAQPWRDTLAQVAPKVITYGLRGLGDAHAWKLRDSLCDSIPRLVAKSITGTSVEGTRADAMRMELFKKVPLAVLSTLGGSDSEMAWKFRELLLKAEKRAVVSSLSRLDTDKSWQWRERYTCSFAKGELYSDILYSRPLLSSVRGVAGEEAWAIREKCQALSPVQVLKSLSGLACERSWKRREEFAALAPKVVLRSFDGQDNDRAWAMRKRFGSKVKEALDSMKGLDGEQAWAIREALIETWPSTVVSSLGELAGTERGLSLVQAALAEFPTNISLLKHATQISVANATGGAARRRLA